MKRADREALAERQLTLFGKVREPTRANVRVGALGLPDKARQAEVFAALKRTTKAGGQAVKWLEPRMWRGGMRKEIVEAYRAELRKVPVDKRDAYLLGRWKWLTWDINTDGSVEIVDGRHRFSAARAEAGDRDRDRLLLPVKVRRIGARGRVLETWAGPVKMGWTR